MKKTWADKAEHQDKPPQAIRLAASPRKAAAIRASKATSSMGDRATAADAAAGAAIAAARMAAVNISGKASKALTTATTREAPRVQAQFLKRHSAPRSSKPSPP